MDHDEGLEGPGFACLQYLFLFAGQSVQGLFATFQDCERKDDLLWNLLNSLWFLSDTFIRSRARMRSPEFDKVHGPNAFEAAAVRFFPFFKVIWQWIQVCRLLSFEPHPCILEIVFWLQIMSGSELDLVFLGNTLIF